MKRMAQYLLLDLSIVKNSVLRNPVGRASNPESSGANTVKGPPEIDFDFLRMHK